MTKSYEVFSKLRPELEDIAKNVTTEADTRLQIIDRFLIEVLGWPRELIQTETHGESGYVDYLLKSPDRALFVIEAKRQGKVLVDTASQKVGKYRLGGKALDSAQSGIDQGRKYCFDHGVTHAALTSGFEWIAFTATRTDGKDPKSGTAIVYPSLSSIDDEFGQFHDLFSYAGHVEQLHRIRLQAAEGNKVAHKVETHSVWDPSRTKLLAKSGIAADMSLIFREFFSNMSSDNPEMLAKCFVETKESREADGTLQKIAENLINKITVMRSGTGEQLAERIERSVETKRGEFVLIVGNKGAGKSTFIDRFFQLVLSDDLRKKCLLLRIDIGDSPGDKEEIYKWLDNVVQDLIETQLFESGTPTFDELQGIFWREYQRWRDGEFKTLYDTDKNKFKIKFGEFLNDLIQNDKQKYVDRLLKNAVRSRGLLPCLVFDNTDHFSQSFQEVVFQYAQSLFRASTSFVICPITDHTVWQMSKAGPLQSYNTTHFYLPIPSTKDVLCKRIEFVKDKLQGDDGTAGTYFTDRGITLKIPDIEKFAFAIEDIFVNTEYLGRIVGWLSNHDIRRGLGIAEEIATSPHLSIESLVTMYVTQCKGAIANWKIRKALILGDYNSFRQDTSSFIVNCFALPAGINSSPLGVLSILQLLMDVDSGSSSPVDAYVELDVILNYLEPIGFAREAILAHLAVLLKFRLVEPFDPTEDRLTPDQRIRVTHCGRIHFEFCIEDRTYIEQMSLVTNVTSVNFVTAERLRLFGSGETNFDDWAALTSNFVKYCLDEDKVFVSIPATDTYSGQVELRKRFGKVWSVEEITSKSDKNA